MLNTPVTTEYMDTQLLNAAIGSSTAAFNGVLHTVDMGLIVNDFVPSKTAALTDITEPAYTGYVRQALTYGSAFRDAQLGISSDPGLINFQMTNATTATVVKGYFVCSHTGGHLLYAQMFDTPVPLNDALDVCGVITEFTTNNKLPGDVAVVQ